MSAIVSFETKCPTHGTHEASDVVSCFGEATGTIGTLILETAIVDEIPSILRELTAHDGTESFGIDWIDELTGRSMVVNYIVLDVV